MTQNTIYICQKCGRSAADPAGWIIAQRKDKPAGYLIIRCPDHATDHARRQAGLRQEYYHQHKPR